MKTALLNSVYIVESPIHHHLLYLGDNVSYLTDNSQFEIVKVVNIESPDDWLSLFVKYDSVGAVLIEHEFLSGLDINGFNRIQSERGSSKTPVIVITKKDESLKREIALSLGVDGCISSDASMDVLLEKVKFLNKVKSLQKEENSTEIMYKNYGSSYMIKRAFDLSFACFALFLLLPVLVFVAFLIKIESRGPIFYISQRAGRKYTIFNFYKFRTMAVGADKELVDLAHLNEYGSGEKKEVFYKIKDDPRVTRIGQFLRNTSLDELPQLVNIIKGDMSIVGNRPLPLYEAKMLTNDSSAERFLAPSGLTGLWQVKKRGTVDMSNEERINLDKQYARQWSVLFDLELILKTFPVFVQKESV